MQRGRRLGIRAGTSHAVVFQRADQGRLAVTGRRLGLFPLVRPLQAFDRLAFLKRRKRARLVVAIALLRLAARDPHVTREGHFRRRGMKDVAVRLRRRRHRLNLDGPDRQFRRFHLTGDKPFPDQRVELQIAGLQPILQTLGRPGDIRRPDGFVRLLGAAAASINGGGFRAEFRAELFRNKRPARGNGFLRDVDRIGTHVRNQADGALGDVHALVEPLGNRHRTLR